MLKQRIITAIILVALVLLALTSDSSVYWRALINLAVFVGFWEWLRFCKIESMLVQLGMFAVFALICAAMQFGWLPLDSIVQFGCVLWLVLIVFTMTSLLDFLHTPFFKVPIGMAILSIGGLIVIELKNLDQGALWILGFMVSVWAADVGAYFVGKRFGKTKLAPHVSPGKTVEGLLGGLVFALLIFVPLIFYVFDSNHAAFLVAAVIVTVLVSVMGDLFESKQKRFADLKDSSQVLPGHGGVLDRIDSLLSAAPFFAITLILLGYW